MTTKDKPKPDAPKPDAPKVDMKALDEITKKVVTYRPPPKTKP